jgi:hypothetical protein
MLVFQTLKKAHCCFAILGIITIFILLQQILKLAAMNEEGTPKNHT